MTDVNTDETSYSGASKNSATPDWLRYLTRGLAGMLTLAAVAQAADLPSRLGYSYYTEQFLAVVLGLSLALVFLLRRIKSGAVGRPSVPDLLLAAIGLFVSLYVAWDYPSLLNSAMMLPWHALAAGGLLFLLVLEGLRRTVGMTLVVVVLVITGYGLIGHLVPGVLQTREVAAPRLAVYLAFDPNGLFGITLSVAATVVVAFILFGQILLRSGGADFFNDIALATMGRRRGGAAKISIVASGLFGSISGVVVSNIVATGVVTIRLMINAGFRRTTAAAVEAVASTGGQIAPPVMGAVAFLMADILQKPYSEIVIAAIVPALLYYVSLYVQADLQAAKHDIRPVEGEEIPPVGRVMSRGWVFALPFTAIVAALFWFNQRAETAALWGGRGCAPDRAPDGLRQHPHVRGRSVGSCGGKRPVDHRYRHDLRRRRFHHRRSERDRPRFLRSPSLWSISARAACSCCS
ncbi:TRAP transporter large permease subunit [Roseibium salinum]|nr:TRAP transporter large permease subunit [Roseibium salinum]